MASTSIELPETAGKAGNDRRGGVPQIRGGAYAPESASPLCPATAAAASLPLPTCMGTVGIGGTWGICSGAPLSISASSVATSSLPKSASEAESAADLLSPAAAGGVSLSKNRSSSTGTGMTSVLFFSAATSTTVCSSL